MKKSLNIKITLVNGETVTYANMDIKSIDELARKTNGRYIILGNQGSQLLLMCDKIIYIEQF